MQQFSSLDNMITVGKDCYRVLSAVKKQICLTETPKVLRLRLAPSETYPRP